MSSEFVARLFRGEGLLATCEKNPASEDTGYNNQLTSKKDRQTQMTCRHTFMVAETWDCVVCSATDARLKAGATKSITRIYDRAGSIRNVLAAEQTCNRTGRGNTIFLAADRNHQATALTQLAH